MAIDVTVVVPCYNTERYLDQALTSAEQNGLAGLEIIVLNDGSTDGSLGIMRAHESRDRRVRVIDKPNQGYGATVNRGIEEARGAYVAILEPDDWVRPHAYDDMFELARSHDMPDVVKAAYWRVMMQESPGRRMPYGYLHGRVRHVEQRMTLVDEPVLIQYHPSVWSCLYSREFLGRTGIRMVEAPGAGWVDNPFAVRTLAAARSIVYTDEPFYCYREDLAEASSAHMDALLMARRWHDRQDALEELGVTDEGVRRANCIAGLQFVARMLAQGDEARPEVVEAMRGMCERMDARTVSSVDCVPPHVVATCLGLMGADVAAGPSKLAYARHLAREALWAVRNNGVGFLAHNLVLAHQR